MPAASGVPHSSRPRRVPAAERNAATGRLARCGTSHPKRLYGFAYLIYHAFMTIDWTGIYAQDKGLWVALDGDETTVISSGKTLKEALQKAHDKGYAEPIMSRVPERLEAYVGLL